MKYPVNIITISVLTFAFHLILPFWWIIAIIPFFICFFSRPGGFPSFMTSFLAISLTWGIAAFSYDWQNNQIISTKMAELIFKKPNPVYMIFLTMFIGGIVGGISGLSGYYLNTLIKK